MGGTIKTSVMSGTVPQQARGMDAAQGSEHAPLDVGCEGECVSTSYFSHRAKTDRTGGGQALGVRRSVRRTVRGP